jgi:hypothetical protein
MCVALHANLLVVVHPEGPPSDAEWEAYLSIATEIERATGSLRTLVLTRGGVPSAAQRAAYTRTVKRAKAAVVSSSIAARATTRYMAIWNRAIRPFDARELDDALRYLDLEDVGLRPLIAACEARLGLTTEA